VSMSAKKSGICSAGSSVHTSFARAQTRITGGRVSLVEKSKVGEGWEYDLVGRPAVESSRFDVLSPGLSRRMAGSTVTACRASPLGDLELEFSNGVRFEAFTADSLKCEVWRLVDYLTGEHLVTFEE